MNLFAQTAVEQVLNTLPEGLLLATCAWLLLRLLPRQNSGTRFAIWMVALAGVAGLPFLRAVRTGALALLPRTHPEITLSPFWAEALLILWIPISLIALARIAAGLWQVRLIRRSCREIPITHLDPDLRERFADVRRPVRLLVSDQARVPAAMGFRHPVVVMPAWTLSDLPAERLQHILIHELAHIRRHDDWTNLVQKIARAVFFFHPAVWWIDARLSLEREMACDEAVLAATGNPHAYAGCLIDLLERGCARRGWTMAQAAVVRARDASVRIARILHESSPVSTRLGRKALGLAAGVSLACSGIVLCIPGFVSFAPAHSRSFNFALAASNLDNARLPASEVVPALYRPAAGTHSGLSAQTAVLHSRTIHRETTPQRAQRNVVPTMGRKKHALRAPVVMASLKQSPHAQPLVSSGYLIIQSTQYVPAGAPLSQPGARSVSIEEGSILQVQMVQIVRQDSNGIHVEIYRVVMRVPAAIAMEGTAQSI